MRLLHILRNLDVIDLGGQPDFEITKLTADSRAAQEGALFVALSGSEKDGHDFLADAERRGAAAAVGEKDVAGLGIPYFRVPDSRLAWAQIAAAWYDHPSHNLILIGVTGTDGKTTTASLIHRILRNAGCAAGLLTTLNVVIGSHTLDTGLHVTTPDALEIQGYLAQMVDEGITHCVLEATSHGLAQQRVGACEFDVAVVTNITHEHLDYHGSYEAYRQAKSRLFSQGLQGSQKPFAPEKTAVLNRDDASYDFLRGVTNARCLTYGLKENAGVYAKDVESRSGSLHFTACSASFEVNIESNLIGRYNVPNCLAALTVAVEALGIAPAAAAEGIAQLKRVPGRMQRIDLGQSFTAIVDFAHTPNALRRALETAREITQGRVIAVFGSAGLRDREKRRMMAEVSAELADLTILTAEDPRTESLDSILEEMAQGARAKGGVEGKTFWRKPDRGDALRFAVREAHPGDLVIACGKGHEQSMCFGAIEYPWDDRTAMQVALAELLGIEGGPAMPYLPTSEA
ncbi:MAG: UDP-N-acetylmuramoyl-L-alanyl-D-glutamate--2,6-diaminopimelate ligase [Anaerolineales bacterium]|jgi:UDP-N-acetylmuramoyl-L-alanyl-D-glutamate--2,6-diaminopimelate ligase